jgi:hypothetical protein
MSTCLTFLVLHILVRATYTRRAKVQAESILTLVRNKTHALLKKLQLAIRFNLVHQSGLNQLINTAFHLVTVTATPALQLAAVHILTAVFVHHPKYRVQVLDDTIEAFGKHRLFLQELTPKNRSSVAKAYPVDLGFRHAAVSMLTALTVTLLVAAPTAATDSMVGSVPSEWARLPDVPALHAVNPSSPASPAASVSGSSLAHTLATAYTDTQQLVDLFANRFLGRYLRPTSDLEAKVMVGELLEDLHTLAFLPEWPVAADLLGSLVLRLRHLAMPPRDDAKTDTKSTDPHRSMALDLLSSVCLELHSHVTETAVHELQLRPRIDVSLLGDRPDAPGEDSSCVCSLPHKTGMLDCDDCHKWFHFVCMGLDESLALTTKWTWYCDSCRLRRYAEFKQADALRQQPLDATQALLQQMQKQAAGAAAASTSSSSSSAVAVAAASPAAAMEVDDGEAKGGRGKGKDKGSGAKGKKKSTGAASSPEAPATPSPILEGPLDPTMSLDDVLRQSVLEYLVDMSSISSTALFARHYWLTLWAHDAMQAYLHPVAATDAASSPAASPAALPLSPVSPAAVTAARIPLRKLVALARVQWSLTVAARGTRVEQEHGAASFSRPVMRQMSRQLLQLRPVMSLALMVPPPPKPHLATYEANLFVLMRVVVNDTKPAFRARGLKALAEVIDGNPALLREPKVKQVVIHSQRDLTVSVREAALDLIGRYLLTDLDFAYEYHDVVLACLEDKGISVRKRAMKILGDVCLKFPHHRSYTVLCVRLLHRLRDEEETIQKQALKIFQTAWFSENEVNKARVPLEKNRASALTVTFAPAFAHMVTAVADVVQRLVAENADGFDLLAELVQALFKEELVAGKSAVAYSIARDMCACAIALLIPTVDAMAAAATASSVSSSSSSSSAAAAAAASAAGPDAARAASYLRLLHMFATVRPELSLPHLRAVQPYIKRCKSTDPSVPLLAAAIGIIRSALPLLPGLADDPATARYALPEATVALLASDLLAVFFSGSMAVIKESIPCLCALATHAMSGPPVLIEQFLTRCVGFLTIYMNDPSAPNATTPVPRCLLGLGLLSKHFQLDQLSVSLVAPLSTVLRLKRPGRITDVLAELFRHFCNQADSQNQSFGLQGLCSLFSQRPELLKEFQSIFKAILNDAQAHPNPELQLLLLKSLSDFVKSEQSRVEYLQHLKAKERVKQVKGRKAAAADGDEEEEEEQDEEREDEDEQDDDGDDGMGGAAKEDPYAFSAGSAAGQKRYGSDVVRANESEAVVNTMQNMLPLLLVLCLHQREQIRHEAFSLVRSLDAQGMVIPRFVVPTFLAGLVDPAVSEFCLERLNSIHERFPEFIRTGLLDGIAAMTKLCLSDPMFPVFDPHSAGYARVKLAVERLYPLVKAKGSNRHDFLSKLVDTMAAGAKTAELTTGDAGTRAARSTAFMAVALSLLPYDGDEPLQVCDVLNHAIGATVAQVEAPLREALNQASRFVLKAVAGMPSMCLCMGRLAACVGVGVCPVSQLCAS